MRHPMVGWVRWDSAGGGCGIRWLVGFAWAALVEDAASDGWLVCLGSASGGCGIRWLVGLLGQRWWTMRHPTINGTRTARKFAASGRQKGAPGDYPIFRIIIRLENALAGGRHGAVNGTLGSGCQSSFLNTHYPSPDAFLDGTFVASRNGALAGLPVSTNVSKANGGLGVKGVEGSGPPLVPVNSVRDVAISSGILFVCDEVDSQVNMYDLNGGAPLAPGAVPGSPTQLAISNGGLWVSAGQSLYWSALPTSASLASLKFQAVAIGGPPNSKIGGTSFDDSGNVYVIFQDGTGGTGSGSIAKYAVTAGSPPSLAGGSTFATISEDTPEFCMWVSDSTWPSIPTPSP